MSTPRRSSLMFSREKLMLKRNGRLSERNSTENLVKSPKKKRSASLLKEQLRLTLWKQ